MKKILVITCYFDPDYVRARTLRSALGRLSDVEVVVVKNSTKGLLRYPQAVWRLWRAKHREKPDVYLLTFRGQEILPFVLWLAGKKPVWFDEFIVPLAWASQEKHKLTPSIALQKALARIMAVPYKRWLRTCSVLLADTDADADISADLSGVSRSKYLVVPVGAEEELFVPKPVSDRKEAAFEVFFCGNMRPLYGLKYVLQAAEILKKENIHFQIVGGKQQAADDTMAAKARGAKVDYAPWVPYEKLPDTMRRAGVCLAGQYGNTPQAHRVVSGKAYQMLACAAPTIIGESAVTKALFHHQKDTLLVPQADPAALADAILWARDHPSQLRRIGQQGRNLYEKAFSIEAITRILRPLAAKL